MSFEFDIIFSQTEGQNMLRNIFIVCCIIIVQSCASSKGYIGEIRPPSELATIYVADVQKYGKLAKQFVLIEKINELTVGNYKKGYPRKVEVLPGEIKITVKFDTMTFGKALVSGLAIGGGGAVAGAIAGSINNSGMANNEMIAQVEKGKSYKINFSSETHTISDLKIWLEPFTPNKKRRR